MPYRAVIFDLGGVVFPSPFEIFAEYERCHALPERFIREVVAASAEHGAWARLERSEVTFEQARQAKQAGFVIEMRYLALRDFRMHLERVKARADTGGHSASEATLRRIYAASLMNLRRAMQELDVVWVYDNTDINASHPLVLEARNGEIHFIVESPPDWLSEALDLS